MAAQATQVAATYVLFSDDDYYTTSATGVKHFYFQNTPAWVVTFQGVSFPTHGPRGIGQGTVQVQRVNHEVNVVINAQTGERMEIFSYR